MNGKRILFGVMSGKKRPDCILVHTNICLEKRDQSLSWCIQATWLQRNGRYANASSLLLVVPAYLSASPFAWRTLATGHGYVQHALSNSRDRQFIGEDGRGKQSSFNRIPDNVGDKVRKHSLSLRWSPITAKSKHQRNTLIQISVSTKCITSMLRNTKRLVNHHSPDLFPDVYLCNRVQLWFLLTKEMSVFPT